MITLKEFKKNQMKNVEFVKEYKDIQPEMDLIRAMIEAREYSHITVTDKPVIKQSRKWKLYYDIE